MVGSTILRLFPPDRIKEEEVILSRIARGERVNHFETVRMRKDGQPIDVSVYHPRSLIGTSLSISPIYDADGIIVGASKIVWDILEQKRVTRALQRSEEVLSVTRYTPGRL
jgi:PAS domain S-box-containing protein